MNGIVSQAGGTQLTIEEIFGDAVIGWGKKYPRETLLREIWKTDREYLEWAAGVAQRKAEYLLPPMQRVLVELASRFERGADRTAIELEYRRVQEWIRLARDGVGLEDLERPSAAECLEILERCTVLAGHGDLDGVFSMAGAIAHAGALGGVEKCASSFSSLRILRYRFRSLAEYTSALNLRENDSCVIIDFAAHPTATLTIDHHTTSLSFWEFGRQMPRGIYDPSAPSCPHLLAKHCGVELPSHVISGCDMIDGALYPDIELAFNLANPYVALGYALDLDVSDSLLREVIISLAREGLDPEAILCRAGFNARRDLIECELAEQRSYWEKGRRIVGRSAWVAVADGRVAPYSMTRFRYLPFENPTARSRPYLIALRNTSSVTEVNLGIGRNPFYHDREFFRRHPLNLGATVRRFGSGGGRMEAASLTVPTATLENTVDAILTVIEDSIADKPSTLTANDPSPAPLDSPLGG